MLLLGILIKIGSFVWHAVLLDLQLGNVDELKLLASVLRAGRTTRDAHRAFVSQQVSADVHGVAVELFPQYRQHTSVAMPWHSGSFTTNTWLHSISTSVAALVKWLLPMAATSSIMASSNGTPPPTLFQTKKEEWRLVLQTLNLVSLS